MAKIFTKITDQNIMIFDDSLVPGVDKGGNSWRVNDTNLVKIRHDSSI